jgi:hypothetical protein
VELGIIAKKPATPTTVTFDLTSNKDFPPLG